MGFYASDRSWSDRFIPAIKGIVGPRLLEPSSFDLDAKEATDLIVFKARDMRIAARVRRHGFADRYPHQFTIRAKRNSGAATELTKIIDGWGDWLFYGHADNCDVPRFTRWMIVDLHAFRAHLIRQTIESEFHGRMPNGDGTHFHWFDIRGFSSGHMPILVASSFADELIGEAA